MSDTNTHNDLTRRISELEADTATLRETEQSLRKTNELVTSILDTTAIGVGLIENRVFIRVNAALMRIFGYENESDVVGKSVRMIYPTDEDYDRMGERIYGTLAAGAIAEIDVTLKRYDGSSFSAHLKVNAMDESDPMRRAIATVSDITWRKDMEAEQMEKERLQGLVELAGAVCHEMNQPIQVAMLEFAKIQATEAFSTEEISGPALEIKRQLDRMREITLKLTHLTRYKTRDYVKGTQIVDLDEASINIGE